MTESTTTDTAFSDNLGNRLRQAREALNLSIEDAAKKINLRVSVLEKIEKNQFVDPNIPSTFMRGYIRSYLKFLKLPESLLNDLSSVFGETPKHDLNKNIRAKKTVNRYSSYNRWMSTITWLIVLIAIAMTVLWWWENHQQSNAERDNLVENYVSTESVQNPAPLIVKDTKVPVVAPSGNDGSTIEQPQQIAVKSEPLQLNETAPQQDNIPANVVSQTESAVDSEQNNAPQESAATDAELRIEVTGSSCWISVKDGNRKEQAGKLYKQGETLAFNGGSPYSLIIGAPGNVKITYQGDDVPLKVDGKVKKFKLPQ